MVDPYDNKTIPIDYEKNTFHEWCEGLVEREDMVVAKMEEESKSNKSKNRPRSALENLTLNFE